MLPKEFPKAVPKVPYSAVCGERPQKQTSARLSTPTELYTKLGSIEASGAPSGTLKSIIHHSVNKKTLEEMGLRCLDGAGSGQAQLPGEEALDGLRLADLRTWKSQIAPNCPTF